MSSQGIELVERRSRSSTRQNTPSYQPLLPEVLEDGPEAHFDRLAQSMNAHDSCWTLLHWFYYKSGASVLQNGSILLAFLITCTQVKKEFWVGNSPWKDFLVAMAFATVTQIRWRARGDLDTWSQAALLETAPISFRPVVKKVFKKKESFELLEVSPQVKNLLTEDNLNRATPADVEHSLQREQLREETFLRDEARKETRKARYDLGVKEQNSTPGEAVML
ncbi:hypothetical protein MMC13_003296 [Lambiella insularis]|nr:hypothetical protein [Lambiella insularis]